MKDIIRAVADILIDNVNKKELHRYINKSITQLKGVLANDKWLNSWRDKESIIEVVNDIKDQIRLLEKALEH